MVKTVDIASENATGDPNSGAEVVIRLVDGGLTSADAPTRLFLDENGEASVDLEVNENGSFYRMTVFVEGTHSRQRQIQLLEGTASPIAWDDPTIQVDPQQPPPVVTPGGGTLEEIDVPADSTGVLDPDTQHQAFVEILTVFGKTPEEADAAATALGAYFSVQNPTKLDILVANIARFIVVMAVVDYMNGVMIDDLYEAISSKEEAGVAATLISALNLGSAAQASATDFDEAGTASNLISALGSAAQAAVEDFAAAAHNHDGVYEAIGVAAGLVNALTRPNGPRITTTGSESEMVNNASARQGDYCFRSDQNMRVYVLMNGTSTGVGDWSVIRWSADEPIPKTTLSAKGSILVASGASTPSEITVPNTRRRILTPNSSTASGLEWTHPDPRVASESGDVVSVLTNGYSNAMAISVNTMQGHPIWLTSGAIDRIGVYHTANGTSTWRIVLYPASTTHGRPNGETLLLDAGVLDMSTGATAWNWKTVAYTIPHDGWYWAFAIGVTYTSSPSIHCISYLNYTGAMLGSPVNSSSVGRQQVGLIFNGLGASTAPATCPTSYGVSGGWQGLAPKIHVRYA